MGSFWIRDRAHVSCLGWRILYHWATREALACPLLKYHKGAISQFPRRKRGFIKTWELSLSKRENLIFLILKYAFLLLKLLLYSHYGDMQRDEGVVLVHVFSRPWLQVIHSLIPRPRKGCFQGLCYVSCNILLWSPRIQRKRRTLNDTSLFGSHAILMALGGCKMDCIECQRFPFYGVYSHTWL